MKSTFLLAIAIVGLGLLALASRQDQGSAQQATAVTTVDGAVYFTRVTPTGPETAALSAVRTVSSVEDLLAAIGPRTNVIVIDDSVRADADLPAVLVTQLKEGRSIVGVNISLRDLEAISGFVRAVQENQTRPDEPQVMDPPASLPGPGYSYLSISRAGSDIHRFGNGQRLLADGTFRGHLDMLSRPEAERIFKGP